MEYPDNELLYYFKDNNETASDIIYDKYKYIIDVLISKYRRVFLALNIDLEEVKQEANLAFTNALITYNANKDASLSTFINLCVERKIRHVIKKYETDKNKIMSDSISFDQTLYDDEKTLESIIGDETYEPSKTIENKDMINYINKEVVNILSESEIAVYKLMMNGFDYIEIADKLCKTPKQIDNTIQRIRSKLKNQFIK